MDDSATDRLEGFLGYQLRRASAAAMAELTRTLARFGLRPTLYAILVAIESTPVAGQSGIGRRLAIQRANMVPLLAELERTGWIERSADPHDRRGRRLAIAPGRRAELVRVHAAVDATERALETRAGGDPAALRAALSRIWAAADAPVHPTDEPSSGQ